MISEIVTKPNPKFRDSVGDFTFLTTFIVLRMTGNIRWAVPCFFLLGLSFTITVVFASGQCRIEANIQGMALKGFVFKTISVSAPYKCDVRCEREITCQSYNYLIKENICELNNRTKEARLENFLPDPARFYIRRLNGRGMSAISLVS